MIFLFDIAQRHIVFIGYFEVTRSQPCVQCEVNPSEKPWTLDLCQLS